MPKRGRYAQRVSTGIPILELSPTTYISAWLVHRALKIRGSTDDDDKLYDLSVGPDGGSRNLVDNLEARCGASGETSGVRSLD